MFLVGGLVLMAIYLIIYFICRGIVKKQRKMIEGKKQKADVFLSEGKFAESIRVWKELLPQVADQIVQDILPKLRDVYSQMGSQDGLSKLTTVERLYNDFFDMNKRFKQLDAKGRAMRQSLAEKICKEVAELPER